jgi:hypothetical protein
MRIKLSGKGSKSQDKKSMSVSGLNSQVLDSQATDVLLDNFLCEFSINEIKKLMELIKNKCRIGCVVTIIEKDFDILFSDVAIGVQNLDDINSRLEDTKGLKSLLTTSIISTMIPSNFQITNKHFDIENSTVTIRAKRVK